MVSFSFLCVVLAGLLSQALSESIIANYPTAFTQYNRIMAFILNYSYDHIDPLLLIFGEYVSMCEGGWDPTVVIHTTSNWTQAMHRYIRGKTYCYRTGASIKVRVDVHDKSVGTGLAMKHKMILREELNNHDFFVYHEDDIIFKFSHLVAYLNETKKLADLNTEEVLTNSVIGFQRYRRMMRGDIHSAFGEKDIFEQEMMEEMPEFVPICLKEEPYLLVKGNTHQAIWAFTTGQLKMLQQKCNFLDHVQPSREFMSSFLIFEHKPHFCAMNKLYPAERFQTMNIWHYYQQHHVSWTSVFNADEHIRAGGEYKGGSPMYTPPCWKRIVDQARAEQAEAPTIAPTADAGTSGGTGAAPA